MSQERPTSDNNAICVLKEINVPRGTFFLLVGKDMNAVRGAYIDTVKKLCSESPSDLTTFFNKVAARIDEVIHDKDCPANGCMVAFSDNPEYGPDCYCYLPKYDEAILVHEVVHAVSRFMEHRGVEDEEFRAYATEFLFAEFKRSYNEAVASITSTPNKKGKSK